MASKTALVILYREPVEASARHVSIVSSIGRGDDVGDGFDRPNTRRRGAEDTIRSREGRDANLALGKTVAIVEDDFNLLTSYTFILERLGYKTMQLSDGDEIVARMLNGKEEEASPDVILMDYRMPKMDGLEAAKRILRQRPDVKIIISTADDSVRREAVLAGMTFLQKPFSMDALADAIKKNLGSSATHV